MSADFSRFAILAAPVPEAAIPEDLITGLELACNQGPLKRTEQRSIGTIRPAWASDVVAELRRKLEPLGLDVVTSGLESPRGPLVEIAVCRLAR